MKEAYDTLSDPQKKSHYDQFGHTDPNQGFGGAGGAGDFGGFSDIFDMFFGGNGADVAIRMRLAKEMIYNIR